MRFLKVPRKDGERTRQELMTAGALDNGYPISSEAGFVYLPLVSGAKLPTSASKFETVEREAERRESPPKKLADALSGLLTEAERGALIASFDIIGDIAIVEIPEGLEPREKEIGEALLRVHNNVKTVLKKLGPMEGEFRVRKLGFLAGENKTETTYRENGVPMKLDVAKVYFSVRLASERKRIAELVKPGERVLVLFAGVGPFALAIAKKRPDARIVAVEINPEAVRYMKENIALNKFDNIEPVEGDARAVPLQAGSFDRVIMPLPKSAEEFLDVAFAAVKDGGMVHFYTLADANDPFGEALEKAELKAEKAGVSVEIGSQRIVRPYSPLIVQVVLDLEVRKT
ncbi:MAG: class I SAM-dependent methyltransferase family protein [Candidatus ainarchaeum sp.]|nr:class I SAM-dependent methyltransferase family protein [Candidatus ainarchaeum sp.]